MTFKSNERFWLQIDAMRNALEGMPERNNASTVMADLMMIETLASSARECISALNPEQKDN